ncbi:hypothetical protein, variant [Allomyces macrogynus ATCC 38327]|uniref:NFX1-type zinc finger-containing protein 1 n=1 Tax=Allomyces macrogynus (strain ATCC 38327) TaxID=578462 RepID=A0A0L0SRD4_ALLM3|nr:hypothetical protein, variant [Allomyces macrogynus ATCC 38327]|eukprot:KNE64930.1 hypothetical protein, variant [Allomyces macrogynus ATCC 38327]
MMQMLIMLRNGDVECPYYFKYGSCRDGDQCPFSHGDDDDLAVEKIQEICPRIAKGLPCHFGAKCRFSHDLSTLATSSSSSSSSSPADATRALRAKVETALTSSALTMSIDSLYIHHQVTGMPEADKVLDDPRIPLPTGRLNERAVAKVLAACHASLRDRSPTFVTKLAHRDALLALVRTLVGWPTYSLAAGMPPRHEAQPGSEILSFQRVLLPLLYVLAHTSIENSTQRHAANTLYNTVPDAIDELLLNVIKCAQDALDSNGADLADRGFPCAVTDPRAFVPVSLAQVFAPVVQVLDTTFKRFPSVTMRPLVQQACKALDQILGDWAARVTAKTLVTVESAFAVDVIMGRWRRAQRNLHTEQPSLADMLESRRQQEIAHQRSRAARGTGATEDDWPDDQLRAPAGAHDNDPADYTRVAIIPTMQEIMCTEVPTLPGNLQWHPYAHWLDPGPARLLDTHFRLLRQDMLASLKTGLRVFLQSVAQRPEVASDRFRRREGAYQVDLMVYVGVDVGGVDFHQHAGVCVDVSFFLPRRALDGGNAMRAKFWDHCLRRDGLVALIWPVSPAHADYPYKVIFATVAEADDKQQPTDYGVVRIKVGFGGRDLDAALFDRDVNRPAYMVEARTLMFEAYRPVLRALQEKAPADLPFAEILCPLTAPAAVEEMNVGVPMFARTPGMRFDVTYLVTPADAMGLAPPLYLSPTTTGNSSRVAAELVARSTLDASQARALVGALTSEVCCIQGPPGTGKSFIGVKYVEALYKLGDATIFPVLVLCYTNHALDQFLEALLDHGIKSVVRVGSKPSDRLREYTPNLWRDRGMVAAIKQKEEALKEVGEELKTLLANGGVAEFTSRAAWTAMEQEFPHITRMIREKGMAWEIKGSWARFWLEGRDLNEWRTVTGGKKGKGKGKARAQASAATAAAGNAAMQRVQAQAQAQAAGKSRKGRNKIETAADDMARLALGGGAAVDDVLDDDPAYGGADVLAAYGLADDDEEMVPAAAHDPDAWVTLIDNPHATRYTVWDLDVAQRAQLAEYLTTCLRDVHARHVDRLQRTARTLAAQIAEMRSACKVEAMRQKKIIGMTTTGAAKFQDTLRALAPKVLLCEEAGEVLEAHVLAALSPSVQQLVLIGDHKQLRPGTMEFSLRSESREGTRYRLDVSMFERLVKENKLPAYTLTAQRRMKPIIAQFVRRTIYPELTDGQGTEGRERVRGVEKDVFFVAHTQPQDGGSQEAFAATASHSNAFEVEMIVALVQYLLRQGYRTDQLVVLTPYVGQLLKVRAALAKLNHLTVLSERDEQLLLLNADEDDVLDVAASGAGSGGAGKKVAVKEENLRQCIRVSSIDNYQGEESDIVLITLVRSTLPKGGDAGIGFLKIENRVNVMLSRARLGMYLVGNADMMRKHSPMWDKVLAIMDKQELVGAALPIYCQQHPDDVRWASTPDELRKCSPDGGCLRACEGRLPCGHACERSCHTDDREHVLVKCTKDCARVHDGCGHACRKVCNEPCGQCTERVDPVVLPKCGHMYSTPRCYEMTNLASVRCTTKVTKRRFCGHSMQVACGDDVDARACPQVCGDLIACGHNCASNCGACKLRPAAKGDPVVTNHAPCKRACGRAFACKHTCPVTCSTHPENGCPPCAASCDATACDHGRCRGKCSDACVPCIEPCTWKPCAHVKESCPLPCGAPCVRVPCDARCEEMLECGHRCPSVCGETCPPKSYCRECCGNARVTDQVVDMIMGETYAEVDLDATPVIKLGCGHLYTVETLDGNLFLEQYYRKLGSQWVGVKDIVHPEEGLEVTKLPTCPQCRAPILASVTKRYGRVIKAAALTVTEKHFHLQMLRQCAAVLAELDKFGDLVQRPLPTAPEVLDARAPNMLMRAQREREAERAAAITALSNAWRLAMSAVKKYGKAMRADPVRALHGAGARAVAELCQVNPALRVEFDRTMTVTQDFVEGGRLHFIEARLARHKLAMDHALGKSIADLQKVMERAREHLRNAIARYVQGDARFRVLEARVELLAVYKVFIGAALDVRRDNKVFCALDVEDRDKFIAMVLEHINAACAAADEALRTARGMQADGNEDAATHIASVTQYVEYFTEARDSIRTGVTPRDYEIAQVIMAVAASEGTTGHWYRCPNGHPYVIGDCGMAMQTARCNECGERIGGGSHTLLATNQHANDIILDAQQATRDEQAARAPGARGIAARVFGGLFGR